MQALTKKRYQDHGNDSRDRSTQGNPSIDCRLNCHAKNAYSVRYSGVHRCLFYFLESNIGYWVTLKDLSVFFSPSSNKIIVSSIEV